MNPNPSIRLSLIVPIYNRPVEAEEILESLTHQTRKDFEIIMVEDGSTQPCIEQVEKYVAHLNLKYFTKPNSGPGTSRNYGCDHATGNYFVFLDSDCIIPPHYVETVYRELNENYVDAFGGPDRAHEKFTVLQKAINYAMTSFITTGGIRGGGEKLDKFYPRSFNMGYSKAVYETTKGFSKLRFGEDIDMSMRIIQSGFKTRLFSQAYVFHKRRSTLKQFFKQVYNSGIARINLFKRHPGSLKAVHALPSAFTLGLLVLLVLSIAVSCYFLMPIAFLILVLFVDSTLKNKSLNIGLWSVVTSFVQLIGYGSGFWVAFWKRIVLRKDEFAAFTKTFYD